MCLYKYVYVCCVIYSRFKCVHINASMYVVLFIAVLRRIEPPVPHVPADHNEGQDAAHNTGDGDQEGVGVEGQD